MLDPLFSEAWVHRPVAHVVLGRKLHPFCALDLLALQIIDLLSVRFAPLWLATLSAAILRDGLRKSVLVKAKFNVVGIDLDDELIIGRHGSAQLLGPGPAAGESP